MQSSPSRQSSKVALSTPNPYTTLMVNNTAFMFEQISTDLQNKSTELHFLKAALNNLELAQVAQEDQKSSWARFTGDAIREFKQRTETLQAEITKLTAKQDALYKTTFGAAV